MDDLIINERPNAHYVRKDAEQSPAIAECFKVLKSGGRSKPAGVSQEVWDTAEADVAYCDARVKEGKHYRIMNEDGQKKVCSPATKRQP